MRLSSISHTAWVVMMCQLALHKDKRWNALVSDSDAGFYRTGFDYCRRESSLFRLLSLIPEKTHLTLVENALARGAPQHYALRKQAIKKQAQECIRQGIVQIVVIGGGFDPLAVSLAQQHPAIRVFEIDMPAMYQHKANLIKTYYTNVPANFMGNGQNLAKTSLSTLLSSHPVFNKSARTLFIAEGLTMYLSSAAMEQLLCDMRSVCEGSIDFLFTAVAPTDQNERGWGRALRRLTLTLNGEHFFWSLPKHEMQNFLKQQNYKQEYLLSFADLQRPWRSPEEMAMIEKQNGEYLVYATANPA